ncbi:MAG: hypothetical protein MI923_12815 [Phycisphaerales bacterium]|nr:hypothetical protein [Phycisphaerales bacterium]
MERRIEVGIGPHQLFGDVAVDVGPLVRSHGFSRKAVCVQVGVIHSTTWSGLGFWGQGFVRSAWDLTLGRSAVEIGMQNFFRSRGTAGRLLGLHEHPGMRRPLDGDP